MTNNFTHLNISTDRPEPKTTAHDDETIAPKRTFTGFERSDLVLFSLILAFTFYFTLIRWNNDSLIINFNTSESIISSSLFYENNDALQHLLKEIFEHRSIIMIKSYVLNI